MTQLEELYHNCRSCHWFDRHSGKCLHGETFTGDADAFSDEVLLMSEEGIVAGAIEEVFSDREFKGLKSNLESSLSKKKAKQFYDEFLEELDGVIRTWCETIDESVVIAIRNQLDVISAEGKFEPAPDNPGEFYCKYFE